MKVIFLEDVPHVARAGDVRDVKTGYAKNYLIPKGLAAGASKNELARSESIRKAGIEKQSRLKESAEELMKQVEDTELVLRVRSGPSGKLYGAITNLLVAEELSKLIQANFDRRDIILDSSIREIGNFQAKVRLHPEVVATINLLIQPTEEQ